MWLLIAAATTFAGWSFAFLRFFRRDPDKSNTKSKILGFAALGAMATDFYVLSANTIDNRHAIAGLLAFAVSAAVFASCLWTTRVRPFGLAFAGIQSQEIVSNGPYSVVRHPIYCAYLMGWLASVVATNSYLAIVVTVLMGAFYARAATDEESVILRSRNGPAYEAYMNRVGQFIPKIGLVRISERHE